MTLQIETFGNAIIQFRRDEEVLLTCDPWIEGTAYFGSWGIEAPLSAEQRLRTLNSKYIWISHGHPDHLHPDSLVLFDKDRTEVLLPDHYDPDIKDYLEGQGFKLRVLKYREWTRLDSDLEILCIDNENQDAILIARFGDLLLINQNDSPLCGEFSFLRKVVRGHPNDKTVLAKLCAVDADMLNIVDASGLSLAGPPQLRKKGAIWAVASQAAQMGIKHFCCSSSQHVYLRPDSAWANSYRITWDDISEHWIAAAVSLHPPYCTITVEPLTFQAHEPEKAPVPTPSDDLSEEWKEQMQEADWTAVQAYMSKLILLEENIDFVGFAVAGVRRDFPLRANRWPWSKRSGIVFTVPRGPLMETVASGYFDDLLIGNFMKTELISTTLYPHFTPRIAKLAGNAKVFTKEDYAKFKYRYFKRNPSAFIRARLQQWWEYSVISTIDRTSTFLGIRSDFKRFYRRILLGHPDK